MKSWTGIILLIFVLWWASTGRAAQVYPTSCPGDPVCIVNIEGRIVQGDYDQVYTLLAQRAGTSTTVVHIDSPGGSIQEAMRIGRLLREHEVGVMVNENSSCISACVLILAGGVIRVPFGKVGIHRPFFAELDPSLATIDVDRAYKAMFLEIRSYLAEMNVPTELADAMAAIPPEEIRYLDDSELSKYLLSQADPAFQESLNSRTAALYGISMDLYRQREAEANAYCGSGLDAPDMGKWITCHESQLWGVSEEEYNRRDAIWEPVRRQLKSSGAPREQIFSCQRAILGQGRTSCDLRQIASAIVPAGHPRKKVYEDGLILDARVHFAKELARHWSEQP